MPPVILNCAAVPVNILPVSIATELSEESKNDNLSISLIKQASDSGQLYGSVTAREISDTIKSLGHDIQTKQIQLKKAIKEIGTHKVKIIIHPEVITSVTVKVARSDKELMSDTLIEKNIKEDDAKNSNQTGDKNSELVEKPINESSSKSTKKEIEKIHNELLFFTQKIINEFPKTATNGKEGIKKMTQNRLLHMKKLAKTQSYVSKLQTAEILLNN